MTDRPGPDLAALVSARILHDLISPLGAIGNGVELLGLGADEPGPELALIRDSLDNARSRLGLLRIAYGAAHPGQMVNADDIRALTAPTADSRRLRVDWQPSGDIPRPAAKLAVLLIQCLETAMPWGGDIRVSAEGDRWQLSGRADRLQVDPALWDMLTTRAIPADLAPARVHFALAGREARAQGRTIGQSRSDSAIALDC